MSDINNGNEGQTQEETFDFVGLLLDYASHWKWFLLSIVICVIAGYVYVSTIVPVYEVSASIYLSESDGDKGMGVVSLGEKLSVQNNKNYLDETQIEILKSRNNLIKIVDSLNLAYGYYEVSTFRDTPIYGINIVEVELDSISLKNLSSPINIFVDKEGPSYNFEIETRYGGVKEHKLLETDSLPISVELSHGTLTLKPSLVSKEQGKRQKIVVSNPNWVAARLSSNLNVGFARNSSTILRINFSTPMIHEGEDVINALVDIYNKDIIADKNKSAMQAEAFIIERLSLIAGELQEVEKEVEGYRRDKKITDISTETGMYLNQTSETDAELAQIELRSQLVGDVEKIVSSQDDYTPIPQVVDDEVLNAKIEAYNKKIAQRAAMLEGGTESNPIVQNMQEDLARSKKDIYRGIENVKHSLNVRRHNLERKDRSIEARISNMPTYERELTGIFREQRIKDNIYNYLLEKREEITLQKTLATPTARLIDNPLGSGPVAPERLKFFVFSLLLGLLIPVVLIFLRRIIFPNFKDKDDLERITRVPILGEISVAAGKSTFVVSEESATPISELFRLVRNNIQFTGAYDEKRSNILLVTSSISGEGKTFVSTNLALTFALRGKKTIVVGMDVRRPVLAHNFNITNDVGVTLYLSGQNTDLMSMVRKYSENENLYILPAGPVPPNPNELLLSDRLKTMLDILRENFDCIIIDSAPIGVVSDTLLIAPYTDLQLYVIRANYSTKRCTKLLHQTIAAGRLKNCYIILNGVNMDSGTYTYRRYGHYGRYGQEKYGYGYSESSCKPKSLINRILRRLKI